MFDVANIVKTLTFKDVLINNDELLNTQACSFVIFLEQGVHPMSSGTLQVVSSSQYIR